MPSVVGHAQRFQIQGLIISVYRQRLVVAVTRECIALAVINPGTQLTSLKHRPPTPAPSSVLFKGLLKLNAASGTSRKNAARG